MGKQGCRHIPYNNIGLADIYDQVEWPNEQSVCLPFGKIGESEPRGFERWSSQTNDFKIDTLSLPNQMLGKEDWLAQCQEYVIMWAIR